MIWELSTGEESARYNDPESPVVHASFSADGRRILTRGEEEQARFWSTGSDLPAIVRELPEGARAFASDDLSGILIVRPRAAPLLIERLDSGESTSTLLAWNEEVRRAWLCNTGRRLVIAGADGTSLWDPHTDRALTALSDHEVSVTDARFDAACLRLATLDEEARVVRLWDARDGSLPPSCNWKGASARLRLAATASCS